MSDVSDSEQQVSNQISIEDLQLSLEVYEIQSDQKLQKLKDLFNEKESLDLRQVFYEQRSSLQIKFQNIIGDLTEFLINQEVPSTQKLRKTFYRILQSPLLLLFKVSRFQIFNLRLNAFDIELEPIEAITELGKQIYHSIDNYAQSQQNTKQQYTASVYESFDHFLQHAKINLIQDEIFTLYSYLRKGSAILKKKMQDKIKIVQIFNTLEEKLILSLLSNQDVKTLKQLSTLNYEIYLLQSNFDVLCFYLKVPLKNIYKEVFKELEILAAKSKQTCNYDMFINLFVKFNQQIIAKLQIQKIQDSYVQYLENAAIILLDLWGCRVCQFREFFTFFKTLFEVHPDKKKFLQICLKHTPKLQKEDIALIRANYRQNVENKNAQLVSLMKKVSLDDINSELNSIYHQILYNLDFALQTKQSLIGLFTLVNANSNIEGFIFTVERAFKQWNHTIDLGNSVKYIEAEFNFPKNLKDSQVIESLRLLTNLCILQSKGFDKDFQDLVSKGTVVKAMTGICKFLLSQQQDRIKFIQQNPICQQFLLQSFRFLQNTLQKNSSQWEEILLFFSNAIPLMKDQQSQLKLQQQICKYVEENLENYKLGNCVKILKKAYEFNNSEEILNKIADIFMRSTANQTIETRNFRFFGKNIHKVSNELLLKSEIQFLKKYACIKDNIIEVKEPSCFKLSQLQVITNPIQFEKAMDNYYFTLDSNAKRFIQFIVEEWSADNQSTNHSFFSRLISLLIKNYPVGIPILCNIRIKSNENVKETVQFRFAEYLVNKLTGTQASEAKNILNLIIRCQTIKYRNGRDYIVEEIIPMIVKRLLTLINSGNLGQKSANPLTLELYEILALSLQKFNLSDLKIDTIQKTLLKINFEIQLLSSQKSVARLSQCYDQIIRVFFRKKELDIKKKGLVEAYEQIVWNEIRSYNRLPNTNPQKKLIDSANPLITEQIMVSPFTLSQEFNNDEYKVKKPEQLQNEKLINQLPDLKFSQILQSIPISEVQLSSLKFSQQKSINQTKQIDLSRMKYDIEFYLGKKQLSHLETKQNWAIKQKNQLKEAVVQGESNEKSITFVQYYMREMSLPQISQEVVLKYILGYLKGQLQVTHIWTNPKNLQKLFVPLVILFDSMTENNKKPDYLPDLKSQSPSWQQIIQHFNSSLIPSLKRVLNLFSELGYNNLWSQNYKNFPSYSNLLKSLNVKVIDEESFLSIILKRSLEFTSLTEIKVEIDKLFDKIFTTRPADQTSLMYKVGIDKNLLNLIMKSLEIKNLSNISFLFHSNFNNLRLYTDQLHQGLKALNMASKTRSYNEYIQLAKEIDDQEFFGPMKLFQENFKFFIKIERQGYNFKKAEQNKLCLQRLGNVLRGYSNEQKEKICKECDKLIEQYLEQVEKLQLSIANRVKSFYLVTKLRDLSYQNSISINLINEILREKKVSSEEILQKIKKVDIFSLMMTLHRQLVRFDLFWDNFSFYQKYNTVDETFISNHINFCTTRRYSHSMSSTYQKCDLELDEVIQRCLDQLKLFFSTTEGQLYLEANKQNFYPPFFIKSFIQPINQSRAELINSIRNSLSKSEELTPLTITIKKGESITECISQLRQINKKMFYTSQMISINFEGQIYTLQKFLEILTASMIKNETLVWAKTKESQYLTFNKYKTSQATLQEIQILGYLVGYCIFHKISLLKGEQEILPLQSSIIAAFSFNIIDIQDLLHADFKIWEDVKKILSIEDSKTLNLNFSYIFENTKTLQQERIELVDKGASKKVNNLNRDEFCDAIACHILYNNIKSQISRFIQGILYVIPKELLSNMKLSEIYPLFYNKQLFDQQRQNYEKVMKKYMKKIGVITPQVVIRDGKRIESLKDYQNIEWAVELILQNTKLREKMWPNETNIFILTTIGPKPKLTFHDHTLLIEHFQSKESMSMALKEFY